MSNHPGRRFSLLLGLIGLNVLFGGACFLLGGPAIAPTDTPKPVTCEDRSTPDTPLQPVPEPAALPGHIVFLSNRDQGVDIYQTKADGSELLRLTHNGQIKDGLSVSPDGNWLAFVTADQLYGLELSCARRAGGCLDSDLVWLAKDVTDSSWAADGQTLYASRPGYSIVSVKRDGSGTEMVLEFHFGTGFGSPNVMYWHPVASPKGTTLLIKEGFYPASTYNPAEQWSSRPLSQPAKLVPPAVLALLGEHPAWSPDETRLIWDAPLGLCSQKADGSDQPALWTPGQERADHPTFSPDGKWIAFDLWNQDNKEIYVMAVPTQGGINRDGKSQLNLTRNPATDWQPIWVP